jgi:hypothetical protein
MNRIILIGNGFDLAHGLKTSYKDFIDWLWRQTIADFDGIKKALITIILSKIFIVASQTKH